MPGLGEAAGTSTGRLKGEVPGCAEECSGASFKYDWSLPILSKAAMSWGLSCGVAPDCALPVPCESGRGLKVGCAVALSRLAEGGAAVALTFARAWMDSRRRGSRRTLLTGALLREAAAACVDGD